MRIAHASQFKTAAHPRARCAPYAGWRVAGALLPLPHLLSPGLAHVVHTDLGDGSFRFTMTITHALFGTLFRQEGVFRQVPGGGCG